jgi:hypothetical protein
MQRGSAHRQAVTREHVPLSSARPIAPRQAENHEPDRLLGAAPARASNAGHGDCEIDRRTRNRTLRHRRRGLGADRTVCGYGVTGTPSSSDLASFE